MKKALILSLVMLMVMSLSAFATSTRTLTLGQTNNVLLDDNNVWLYPSRVWQYPNIATAEFARDNGNGTNYYNNFYNFGINWKFGEKKPWVLGTYFSAVPDNGPTHFELDNPDGFSVPGFYWEDYAMKSAGGYTPNNSISTDKRINLLYARQFGKYTFGWGFDYTRGSLKYDTSVYKSEGKWGYYGFTWSLTPDNGAWDIALMTNFGSFKSVDGAGVETAKSDGYTDFGVQGRYFWKYNNTITFVPHAAVAFGSHGAKYPDSAYADMKSKRTAFEFGSGMNYSPANKVLAVLDFGVAYEKVKYDVAAYDGDPAYNVSESEMYFPFWKAGVEGEVFNWMTLRMGATSNWTIYKNKGASYYLPYTDKYAEVETYLGAGFNFNRLHIDTYMDPQIVLHGFDFITGNNGNDYGPNDLNFHVSVLYDMF